MNKSVRRPLSVLLVIAPVVLAIFCIGIGRYSLSAVESARVLWNGWRYGREGISDPRSYSIIFSIRLPRIILALLSGMGLSVSGAAFQALFSNPLAPAPVSPCFCILT
jgi:iron complex transport system permease protein